MDYLEHLKGMKSAFQRVIKCLDYFETYMDVTYVECEDELMELVNSSKKVVSNLLIDLGDKIEACEDGYVTATVDDLLELSNSIKSVARILYYINMSIFNDIFIGYFIIDTYGDIEELEIE